MYFLTFQSVVIFALVDQDPLKYHDYLYPRWAVWFGWSLAISSILMIPLVAIYKICTTPGSLSDVSSTDYQPFRYIY